MTNATAPIFIMVHGTQAKGTAWIRRDSLISKGLVTAFENADIVPFKWSGINSHTARLLAARRLNKTVRKLGTAFPARPIYILAHSHGGTVALYSLRSEELQSRISGLICMGTPFLRCMPRDIEMTVAIFGHCFLFILIALVLSTAGIAIYCAIATQHFLSVLSGGTCAAFVTALFRTHPDRREGRFQSFLRYKASKHQTAVIERLSLPHSIRTPVFCTTATKDEAGMLLWSARSLSEIPFALWKIMVGVGAINLLLLLLVLSDSTGRISKPIANGISISFGWVVAIMISIQLLMWIFPKLARSHALAFGQEDGLDNWLVRIWVGPNYADAPLEEVTIDRATIKAVDALPETNKIKRILRRTRHSLIYLDQKVISRIVSWVRETETKRLTS